MTLPMVGNPPREEKGMLSYLQFEVQPLLKAAFRQFTSIATDIAAIVAAARVTTIEQDLGSALVFRGKFTITDPAITATSKVSVWQAPGPYTGKGTLADEAEMQPVQVIAVEPAVGSCVVKWQTPPVYATLSPVSGGKLDASTGFASRNIPVSTRRVGMVRGNIKFSYIVAA